MRTTLVLNFIASSTSAAFGALALIRPEALSGSNTFSNGDSFYVRMYAARAIPFGLTVGVLPLFQKRNNALVWLLITASVIQGIDVAIAIARKQPGMAMGAATGSMLHLACAFSFV